MTTYTALNDVYVCCLWSLPTNKKPKKLHQLILVASANATKLGRYLLSDGVKIWMFSTNVYLFYCSRLDNTGIFLFNMLNKQTNNDIQLVNINEINGWIALRTKQRNRSINWLKWRHTVKFKSKRHKDEKECWEKESFIFSQDVFSQECWKKESFHLRWWCLHWWRAKSLKFTVPRRWLLPVSTTSAPIRPEIGKFHFKFID